jgi:hypothetical protein
VEEAGEVEEVEEEEEVDQPNRPSQPQLPKETGNWRARNPPSSPAIELKPTSSCTNSNSTSFLI